MSGRASWAGWAWPATAARPPARAARRMNNNGDARWIEQHLARRKSPSRHQSSAYRARASQLFGRRMLGVTLDAPTLPLLLSLVCRSCIPRRGCASGLSKGTACAKTTPKKRSWPQTKSHKHPAAGAEVIAEVGPSAHFGESALDDSPRVSSSAAASSSLLKPRRRRQRRRRRRQRCRGRKTSLRMLEPRQARVRAVRFDCCSSSEKPRSCARAHAPAAASSGRRRQRAVTSSRPKSIGNLSSSERLKEAAAAAAAAGISSLGSSSRRAILFCSPLELIHPMNLRVARRRLARASLVL